jgi:hypothetical protein
MEPKTKPNEHEPQVKESSSSACTAASQKELREPYLVQSGEENVVK